MTLIRHLHYKQRVWLERQQAASRLAESVRTGWVVAGVLSSRSQNLNLWITKKVPNSLSSVHHSKQTRDLQPVSEKGNYPVWPESKAGSRLSPGPVCTYPCPAPAGSQALKRWPVHYAWKAGDFHFKAEKTKHNLVLMLSSMKSCFKRISEW